MLKFKEFLKSEIMNKEIFLNFPFIKMDIKKDNLIIFYVYFHRIFFYTFFQDLEIHLSIIISIIN